MTEGSKVKRGIFYLFLLSTFDVANPAWAQGAQAPWLFPFTLFAFTLLIVALGASVYALSYLYKRLKLSTRQLAVFGPLLEASPDAFIIIDQSGRVKISNRAREHLGLPAKAQSWSDLQAKDDRGFIAPDNRRLEKALSEARETGKVQQLTVQAQGGKARFMAFITPLKNKGLMAIWLRDASDIEEQLLDAQNREVALLERLLRADALYRASPYPIWRRDKDLKISHVNQAYAQAVDVTSPQAVIEQGIELVGASLAQADLNAARKALETNEVQIRTEHVVIGGQRRSLQIINAPLEDAQGVGGYALDITDEENIRAELNRFTRAQAQILNMLSTPVAIFGPEKQLIYHNSAFTDVFHLSPAFLAEGPSHGEILENMRERRRVPEQADFPAWKAAILSNYTNLIESQEDTWHLPDETALRVVTQPHPFGGLLVLYEDVTERLALQRSYDTLIKVQRATLDNLREGVAVFGSDGQLKLSNDVFAHLWALSDEDLDASLHISDIVELCTPLLDEKASAEVLRETVLAATAGRETVQGRLERNDERVIDYAAVPLPDGAALVTFIDVSDSVHIETALRDRNEALETADRLKSEFVTNMSYELRTPLTSIIGFTEMLENQYFGPLNEKQSEYIHNILTSSDRLMVLINDILDLAVTEAGAMALEIGEVDLQDVVNTTMEMTAEAANSKGVQISSEIKVKHPVLQGDERRLKQVLYNLTTNAIRFTPKDGKIVISVKDQGDQLALSVSDTGIGIEEDEQEEVFERFKKGSNAGHVKSAGLGLALVRSFVELHGGEVHLESDVDKGTTVTCLIPTQVAISEAVEA